MEAFEALEADRFFMGVRGDDAGDAMCAGEEPLGELAPCEWGVDGGFSSLCDDLVQKGR